MQNKSCWTKEKKNERVEGLFAGWREGGREVGREGMERREGREEAKLYKINIIYLFIYLPMVFFFFFFFFFFALMFSLFVLSFISSFFGEFVFFYCLFQKDTFCLKENQRNERLMRKFFKCMCVYISCLFVCLFVQVFCG